MPISDPFIDINWPGRPKRNSFGEPDTNKNTNAPHLKDPNVANNNKQRQVSTPSPGTASKPPIFPTSPKVIGNHRMPKWIYIES